MVTRVAVRSHRRLGRRTSVHIVDWQNVTGLTPSAMSLPGQGVAQLLAQFEGQRPIVVADAIRDLPAKRRYEVVNALDDERLADVLQELPESEQADLLERLDTERAADVLEAMDPDDAADLLGELGASRAEALLARMDPEDSEPVRRLLKHSPDTAGGLMTPNPSCSVPAPPSPRRWPGCAIPTSPPRWRRWSFVVRPPTSTPTGRYLGCVHLQRLLREPPAALVSGIIDSDLPSLDPDTSLAAVTRYFAAYNLVCGPVVDEREAPAGRGHRRRRARPSAAARLAGPRRGARAARPGDRPMPRRREARRERPVGAAAPRHPAHVAAPVHPAVRHRGRRAGSASRSHASSAPAATSPCRPSS